MNLSPKRIARIISWVNLPLTLIAFFGCSRLLISMFLIGGDNMYTSTGQEDLSDLFLTGISIGFAGVSLGVLYFVVAYKRNVNKSLSILCWVASIIMNIFCIGILVSIPTIFSQAYNITYIIIIYPATILFLSIKALIKISKSTLEVQG